MARHGIQTLLQDAREAYEAASAAFGEYESYVGTTYESHTAYYGSLLDEAFERARRSIAAALEAVSLTATRQDFVNELAAHSARDIAITDENDVIYSPGVEVMRHHVELLERAAGSAAPGEMSYRHVLERLLRRLGPAFLALGLTPTRESDVHQSALALFRLTFDVVLREVPLPTVSQTFKADFGIQEASSLVEFKFCDSEQEFKKSVAGIYEDMQAYSGFDQWKWVYAVFYCTEPFVAADFLDDDFAKRSKEWFPVIVVGPGSRVKAG